MQYLSKVSSNPDISVYEIQGDYSGKIKRYVVSTAQSRKICNVPETIGLDYTNLMEEAVTLTLKNFPDKDKLLALPEESFSNFVFLRGGLNFGIRNALQRAYGFNRHGSAFMTSQRYREDKRWFIKEDQYRKLKVPDNATLLIGDVVATGSTIANGLKVLCDYLDKKKLKVKNLIFFTIGCHKTEKVLEEFDQKFRQDNPEYGNTYVIYFEGKFKLIDSKSNFKIQIQGTDLVRTPALVAPEFELSQYENVSYPLERCTIYDAGSRSFDIPEYMGDVVEYWTKVKKLAEVGFTLYDALKERWPEQGYGTWESFLETKKQKWKGVDESLFRQIFEAHRNRWNEEFLKKAQTKEALLELCEKRLSVLN